MSTSQKKNSDSDSDSNPKKPNLSSEAKKPNLLNALNEVGVDNKEELKNLKAVTSVNVTGEHDAFLARPKRKLKFQPISRPRKPKRSSGELKPEVEKPHVKSEAEIHKEIYRYRAEQAAAEAAEIESEEEDLVAGSSDEEIDPDDEENPPPSSFEPDSPSSESGSENSGSEKSGSENSGSEKSGSENSGSEKSGSE